MAAPALLTLALLLLGARLAAEVAHRFRQPAVLAEIVLGILIGPSVLNLLAPSESLAVFAELGAVLLLFEVGLQLDLDRLKEAGGAALRVAIIGVALPMAAGVVAARALGIAPTVALFLAAGLTATSVGITARIFADLRMLASIEARTVLGAAVADDVAGLLVLAIVGPLTAGEQVALASIAGMVVLAIGFIVVAVVAGSLLVPRMVSAWSSRSRATGTAALLAVATALLFAAGAAQARLAPIVGAFFAGLALSRAPARERIEDGIRPLVSLFVPLFFVLIGLQTDLRAAGGRELWVAGALVVVAVGGKLAAGIGAGRHGGDRLLVGVSMIPRGEVGLIFASIGLAQGVLDPGSHAILVLVVMATTLCAPPMIRRAAGRRRQPQHLPSLLQMPEEGWLQVSSDGVELAGIPPRSATAVVFDAAVLCADREPGPGLLEWLGTIDEPAPLDRPAFLTLLRRGSTRSWRLLEMTGALAALLSCVAGALDRMRADPFDLDPSAHLRVLAMEPLRDRLAEDDVLVAAFCRAAGMTQTEARALADLLGMEGDGLAALIDTPEQVRAAANRADLASEDRVLELAAHMGTRARARAIVMLATADADTIERERLRALSALIDDALSHPDLTGDAAVTLVDQRRAAAAASVGGDGARFVLAAPWRYVLSQPVDVITRHARMAEPHPQRNEVHLEAIPHEGGWTVHLVCMDRPGLLATIAAVLASSGAAIEDAALFTWPSGVVVDVLKVRAPLGADWEQVRARLEQTVAARRVTAPAIPLEASVTVDHDASPWYTVVDVRAQDRQGLLFRVASALTAAGLDIHSASISTRDGLAVDRFFVTDRSGNKLERDEHERVHAAFAGRRRRLRNQLVTRA